MIARHTKNLIQIPVSGWTAMKIILSFAVLLIAAVAFDVWVKESERLQWVRWHKQQDDIRKRIKERNSYGNDQ